ncbi:4-(cytidine 5'-diphospho)-2-C-methyl-D-erythritol kinase [uncultured Castellaniella sp.]|uniref:4-(cytidine 5'-diphospho)-2-C-methyl-D-erythritol kinase n=1 Tax=uncultured Castellaniella sp. TaxID=647907 RepID=UPI00260B0D52|nr:4-(cytidine 5'-diphospho)-2-C-methyl-D-erythritol kinase [uncultured Castellaniella sp.]
MTALYDVPAPAKLNLFLHVVGRRPDGYHRLQTVFRFIDLFDHLDFERTADGRIEREGDGLAGLPADQDLVLRAARSLRQATGARYGARIAYRKRIPAGGGLGGGSSDAATTLIALNRLWNTGLTRAQLLRLALPLGADVPVFVFGRSAFAQGVGEDLDAVALPPRAYWVLRPKAHIPTADVFRDPDLTRDSESVKISVFADWQTEHSGLFGRNDLESVVCRRHPMIARILGTMRQAGLDARMTGSGSCLFAGFADTRQARVQQDRIISKIHDLPNVVIEGSWVCQGLDDHPLRDWVVD